MRCLFCWTKKTPSFDDVSHMTAQALNEVARTLQSITFSIF